MRRILSLFAGRSSQGDAQVEQHGRLFVLLTNKRPTFQAKKVVEKRWPLVSIDVSCSSFLTCTFFSYSIYFIF